MNFCQDDMGRETDLGDFDGGDAPEVDDQRQVSIIAEFLPEARKQLDKLVRKARRYGNPDISYSVSAPFQEQHHRTRFDGKKVTTLGPVKVTLTLVGEAPRVGPFEFLAKVEHQDGGNIVDIIPGRTVDRRFRSTKSTCEHCNTARSRKETFVLRNMETGQEVQVGRQCLKDYLGRETPAGVAQRFAFLREIQERSEEWGGRGSRRYGGTVEEILGATSAAIRLWGWCSKGQAQCDDSLLPTAAIVGSFINPPLVRKHNEDIFERNEKLKEAFRNPQDWDAAVDILAWVQGGGAGDGDYAHNLKTVLSNSWVEERRFGIACSAVQAYERAMEREVQLTKERETAKVSQWVGAAGERLRNIPVTQVESRVVSGNQFGDCVLVKFCDEAGNLFSWFTGAGTGLNNGERASLTGTVKRHADYKGVKETQLSRCKLEEPK